MKYLKWLSIPLVCLFLSPAIMANPVKEHKYLGVKKCGMCHRSKKKGNQLGKWKKMSHANAYKVLGTAKAKEVGKKHGVADPQNSPKCLPCHVTGYGKAENLTAKLKKENGVGCESCHGAGATYGKNKKVMQKDQKELIKLGLVVPNEKVCITCHNEKSPTYKPFDFKKRFAKVAHPRPKK